MFSRSELDALVEPDPEFAEVSPSSRVACDTRMNYMACHEEPLALLDFQEPPVFEGKLELITDVALKYIEKHPFTPIPWEDIPKCKELNAMSVQMTKDEIGETPEGIEELTQYVTMQDGHRNMIRVIRPANSTGGPLIFLVHGGGFMVGDSIHHVSPARPLALLYNAVVVSAAYRLTPDHVFPTQAQDVYMELLWVAANASSLGADPSKGFVVGGTSAGGNISAVITQMAADNGLTPKITGLWQNITYLMHDNIVPDKYKEHWISRTQDGPKDAVILSKSDLDLLISYWNPDFKSPLYSPFNSKRALEGLPPTFFQVAGGDPLRDDSLIFEDALRQKGVKTKMVIYPGVPHGFSSTFPHLKASEKFRRDLTKGMGWLLGKEPTDEEVTKAHTVRTPGGGG